MAASDSPRSSEKSVRLDPLGVYGTRSARRRHQMQRRRQWQNGLLWLFGIVALGALVWWFWQPHPTSLRANWTRDLPFRPATAPVLSPGGELLFTSQSGGLWQVSAAHFSDAASQSSTAPRRLFSTAFAPSAPPLVTPRRIFWPGADGTLVALDARGAPQWNQTLPGALVSRPALLRRGAGAVLAVGDDQGHVAAFEAITGKSLWRRDVGGPIGQEIVAVPSAVPGEKPSFLVPLLAGTASRGGLVCLDAQTGAPRWRFPTDASAQSAGLVAPTLHEGRVFWGNDEGAVLCLDARDGRKIWKTFAAPARGTAPKNGAASLISLRGAPTIAPSARVVVVGGNDGTLRAFDLQNGAPRWQISLEGAARFAAQLVDFEGREALLCSGDGPVIFLIGARDGRVLRRWTTPFSIDFGVLAAGGTALALDAEGHLQGATLR